MTSPGSGYSNPRIELSYSYVHWECTASDCWTDTASSKAVFSIGVEPSSLRIDVSDSTGWGAELVPAVKDGRIESVVVRSGGQNYTSPKLTVVSTVGSGASLTANVGKAGDYPGAVSYFEQRRWFAGTPTRPQMGVDDALRYRVRHESHAPLAGRQTACVSPSRRRRRCASLHLTPLQQMLAMATNTPEHQVHWGGSAPMAPACDSIRKCRRR